MIEKGQTAWITTSAAPGEKYRARVSMISPVVNPASRTLEIELSLTGKSPIKAGMFVGIELITSTSPDSLTVPEKAIISRDDQNFVYRVIGDHSEKVIVSTGIRNMGLAEITSGLSEGDSIVLEGASLLSEGSRVKILNSGDNR
jgi:membrane fusion protein (multidrug efflux system)